MEDDGLRHAALFATHRERGAKLAPFGGWEVPMRYEGTLAEHRAVRGDVGVFDVSHLGRVRVAGPEAEDLVAATFTNDPRRLEPGRAQYTLCCDEDGGIVDDLIAYRVAGEEFLVVPNAANTAAVTAALQNQAGQVGGRVEVEDVTDDLSMLAVQGPRSLEVLSAVTGSEAGAVGYMGLTEVDLEGRRVLLCHTGYTGEVGGELVVPAGLAPGLFARIVDEHGVTPCGLAARDTLRLEAGYPLHGNDISPDTDPFEARLSFAVKLERGHFRGREALVKRREQGPTRRLLGLRVVDRGIPRPGMQVLRDGTPVGSVTSGTFSPTLRCGIGLAYLDAWVEPGQEVSVDVRGREVAFAVVVPPFLDLDPRGR